MARQFDQHIDLLIEYQVAEAECTKIRSELRRADNHKKELLAEITRKMGKSKIGTVADVEVFEIVPSGRRTVTIDTVMEVCPQLADKLISESKNLVLKWKRKGFIK